MKNRILLLLTVCLLLLFLICAVNFWNEVSAAVTTARAAPQAVFEPAPTPEPTLTPVPTPEPTSPILEGSFFDDAAFIGDSVSDTLYKYNLRTDVLGEAVFLCRGSYSMRATIDPGLLPLSYGGVTGAPQDVLAELDVSKLYVMLGMNDVAMLNEDGYFNCWTRFTENVRSVRPDIQIIYQSVTPVYPGLNYGGLNNTAIDHYNELLKEFCEANGCNFIDVASVFKNENGDLVPEYCADEYVHLTNECGEIWADYLLNRNNYLFDPYTW